MRFSSFFLIASMSATIACNGGESPDRVDAAIDAADDITTDNPVADADDVPTSTDAMDTETPDVVVDAGPPTFEQVQAIFDHSCAVATTQCHNAGTQNNLRLDRGFSYAQIVGVASDEVPRLQRVNAGSAANSYLAIKLDRNALGALAECPSSAFPPPCGNTMPAPPMSPLNAREADLIRRWIDLGATM